MHREVADGNIGDDGRLDPASILIVDDDHDIRKLLADTLADRGYRVTAVGDTAAMDRVLRNGNIDLIILDIMMPGEDGLSACRRLVRDGGPSIVFLSALADERDRILGLELGASHYLSKPCSGREVVATVRAALRLRELGSNEPRRAYSFLGWRMDIDAHELTNPDGALVALTDGEFALLRALVERPRRVLSREALLEVARPNSDAYDRAIDVQISRIRRKLGAPGEEIIRTVRNEGYVFVPTVVRR